MRVISRVQDRGKRTEHSRGRKIEDGFETVFALVESLDNLGDEYARFMHTFLILSIEF
jgi:hypothetical protein